MTLHNRLTLSAAFFMIVLLLLGISSAQADVFYYRWTTPLPTVSCSNPGTPTMTSGTRSVEWNLPSGASLNIYHDLNGVFSLTGNVPVAAGTGSKTFASLLDTAPSFPFDVGTRYDTVINGNVVYQSTIIYHCDGIGTGTVTIINPGEGSARKGGIQDGRINPQNYAPVALYCDGSVLNAYKIDAMGGTFAWSLDLSKASAANPLISGLGVSLSKTSDGRYGVLAAQSDGKPYLFIFNGCPAPGTTETYISDPTTGQFVRTD